MASTSSSQDLNNETPELNISDFSPILGLELEERTEWEYPAIIFKSLDCDKPHDFKLKLETGVKNGDCLLACFAALLESLHRGCITSKDLEAPAAKMRVDMVKWIKQNWTQYPVFNPEMQVHELMWMAHDMGATPEERAHRGEWPEDTDGRLAKYTAICDRIYFSDTEMLLFSSMMYDKRGISLVFRTWRCTGKGQGQGSNTKDTGKDHFAKSPSRFTHANRINPMMKSPTTGVMPKRWLPVTSLAIAINAGARNEVALPDSA